LLRERDLLVFSMLVRPDAQGEAAMNDPHLDAPPTSDELVTVATYDDAVSANLALNYLRESGLAAVVADENTVAMDWLLSNAIRGIKVQVNPNDAKIARGLIEEHDRLRAEEVATTGLLAERKHAVSVANELSPEAADEDPSDADQPDLEEEPPPTTRERESLRAFRAALLGILFPPIELYVVYLVYEVFVSDERLGSRYRNMACAAAIIMMIVLGGVYAFFRPR
jgi:hypothetical protein